MNNNELRDILIKELDLGALPEEVQNDVLSRISETVLKFLTMAIFERLSSEAREEFEKISASGDNSLIKEFLERNIPDIHMLMETEVKKALVLYNEQVAETKAKTESTE